ncbi:MAG: hypothetical protein RL367_2268 [Pseudomonadota bacterium]|jgi:hypothetical protein
MEKLVQNEGADNLDSVEATRARLAKLLGEALQKSDQLGLAVVGIRISEALDALTAPTGSAS